MPRPKSEKPAAPVKAKQQQDAAPATPPEPRAPSRAYDLTDAEKRDLAKLINEGKPEAALPKIIEGRLNGWFKERVLLEQSYVKDEKQTITQLLGNATITAFAQVVIGG